MVHVVTFFFEKLKIVPHNILSQFLEKYNLMDDGLQTFYRYYKRYISVWQSHITNVQSMFVQIYIIYIWKFEDKVNNLKICVYVCQAIRRIFIHSFI